MLISVGVYLALAAVTFTILFLAWRGVLAYFRFRGVRLVSCPETAESAAVEVNARHAALTRGLGETNRGCSRRLFGSHYLDEVVPGKIMCLLSQASGRDGLARTQTGSNEA